MRERRAIKELQPLEIVDTKQWGPQLWLTLHVLSLLSTTDAAKAAWSVLPAQLDGALPCPDCAQHYHDWYRANPLTTTEGDAIRDWVLALHNQVNERKQIPAWSAEQVVATYSSLTVADVRAALSAIAEKIGVGGLRALEELVGLCSTEPVVVVEETVVVEEESTADAVLTE